MEKITNHYESNERNEIMNNVKEESILSLATDLPLSQAPLEVTQQVFHRPRSAQDWETQRPKITILYKSNDLKETMRIMEEQHKFKATYECLQNISN